MWDIGILLLRVVVGLYLFGHGMQKLLGWFDGPGLEKTQAGFEMMGFRPARLWTLLTVAGEAGGGLLMILGLLSPFGALGVGITMLVAVATVHWPKGLWAANNGIELSFTYLSAAVAMGLVGPGRYSLDAALGISVPVEISGIAAVLGLLVAGAAITTRRPAPGAQTAPSASHAA